MKLNNNDDSHNSGLNLLIYNMLLDIESHPAWVCGLKRKTELILSISRGHTLRGCVDWNNCFWNCTNLRKSHTLRGCVDWNLDYQTLTNKFKSHPAWVCGLKHVMIETLILLGCHTLRGCVDWNPVWRTTNRATLLSHPAWVCGLKLLWVYYRWS